MLFRSSRSQMFFKIGVLKGSDPNACNFIKKRLQHRSFLVNIAKFLTPLVAASDCSIVVRRVFERDVKRSYFLTLNFLTKTLHLGFLVMVYLPINFFRVVFRATLARLLFGLKSEVLAKRRT